MESPACAGCQWREQDCSRAPPETPAGFVAGGFGRSGREGRVPGLAAPDTQRSLVEIDDVLNRLAAINPSLRRVVELRVFEGLTRQEIAHKMGCGTATVARHWSFARNSLEDALAETPGL